MKALAPHFDCPIDSANKDAIARTLARTFGSLKTLGVTEREIYSDILRLTLEKYPEFSGVWTVWEPNALDGRDGDYVNAQGHDETGRYIPLWSRFGNSPRIEPNTNYNIPGKGDYYIVPMGRRQEVRMRPYAYYSAVDGQPRTIMSQISPIFFQDRCVGVAGFDILVETETTTWQKSFPIPSSASLSGMEALSQREKEVLSWASQGKSNSEIGLILAISPHTVKHHMAHILAKLGVENRRSAMLCRLQSQAEF